MLNCQQRVAQSNSSFYYSFLFLSKPRREAIMALYAFCREVDDVVDDAKDPHIAQTILQCWRVEVAKMAMGAATHPLTIALSPFIDKYTLPVSYFEAIIDGMEMDLHQTRYCDFAHLQHYCWHVASVVGYLSARIFGISQEALPQTLKYAEKLGLAFQLTNMIRDVGEDARRGRIYLPMDECQQFGVAASDILQARYSDAFKKLMQHQTDRAQLLYDEALSLLPTTERRAQRPGLIMAAIYRALLNQIQREDFHVFDRRISLTLLQKLWLAWRTY